MPFLTIVVSSDGADSVVFTRGNGYKFSYHLPEPIKLNEPHVARLLFVRPQTPLYVFIDFVQQQAFDSYYMPLLGCSAQQAIANWVFLASDHIDSEGIIEIVGTDGRTLGPDKDWTIGFEIAPASAIYGAKGLSVLGGK